MLVIVPNELSDEINRRLDSAIASCPGAEVERSQLYDQLVSYFNDHGVIPDFSITTSK